MWSWLCQICKVRQGLLWASGLLLSGQKPVILPGELVACVACRIHAESFHTEIDDVEPGSGSKRYVHPWEVKGGDWVVCSEAKSSKSPVPEGEAKIFRLPADDDDEGQGLCKEM